MTRAEILSEIKQAEEDVKAMVAKATEAKNKQIVDARVQAKEILRKAEEEAQKKAESTINDARKNIQKEKEAIKNKGIQEAQALKEKSKKNVDKGTKFILTEFERAANA